MSDHMPYVRDGERCDICGALLVAGRIRRVELEPAREPSPDGSRPYRAARVIIVCDRHQLDADRPRDPLLRPAAGTSRKRPQREQLFGGDEPDDGCGTACRYPAICPPCVFQNTATAKLAANDAAGLRDGKAT